MNAMIDVEALRLKQPWKAPLMQIGVVIFDESGVIQSEYEINIKQNTLPSWAESEADTVKFWEEQRLYPILQEKMRKGSFAKTAMSNLALIYKRHQCKTAWFAGPVYDQVMLEAYFDHFGISIPWGYSDCRDFRTIRKQYPDVLWDFPKNPNLHSALDDCRYQVDQLHHVSRLRGVTWK